jgi:hypothetical protein
VVARARKKLTLSQQINTIQATDCGNASKSKRFAKQQKMLWLQSLDSVVQIAVNASEVTDNGFDCERVSATT